MIDVVFFTNPAIYQAFIVHYDKRKICPLGNATDTAAFLKLAQQHKNSMLVVDTTAFEESKVALVIAWLKKEKRKYIAICSNAQQGFICLNHGALDMVIKNNFFIEDEASLINNICLKIKNGERKYAEATDRQKKNTGTAISKKVICIGSSTGGTETVLQILRQLPANSPPILIAQHMPPVFTKLYAERLDSICKMSVWEASDKLPLESGLTLIAPGDAQLRIALENGRLIARVTPDEKYNGLSPSVDVLFHSAAEALGKKGIGVILTGMGSDGAKGLLAMRRAGAVTIGQDAATSIVYGMPRVAYETGAVAIQAPLDKIPQVIMENL